MKRYAIAAVVGFAATLLAWSVAPASAQVSRFPVLPAVQTSQKYVASGGLWTSDDGRSCVGFYAKNHSGATLSSGTLVQVDDNLGATATSSDSNYAFVVTTAAAGGGVGLSSSTIGAFQEASCTNGSYCFVCMSGVGAVKLNGACATPGSLIYAGSAEGQGYCSASYVSADADNIIGKSITKSRGSGDTILAVFGK